MTERITLHLRDGSFVDTATISIHRMQTINAGDGHTMRVPAGTLKPGDQTRHPLASRLRRWWTVDRVEEVKESA